MIKKTTGKRVTGSASAAGSLVPAVRAAGTLARIDDGNVKGSIVRQDGVTLVAGRAFEFGGHEVVADAVYYVGHDKPADAVLGGADKVAWRDVASGYDCIIIRDERGGFLRGFVGVEPGHPLHGFDHAAIPPELGIEVHGGLTYSAVCQDGPTPRPRLLQEARRICHVDLTPARHAAVEHATAYRVEHAAAWWFGFDCDHVHDLVPGDQADRQRFLASETGAVLRDEGYVYDQVVHLAAQLRAIADGSSMPARRGEAPPPLGLDPNGGRR